MTLKYRRCLIGAGFLFTGTALMISQKLSTGRKVWKQTSDSLVIGLAQGVALCLQSPVRV